MKYERFSLIFFSKILCYSYDNIETGNSNIFWQHLSLMWTTGLGWRLAKLIKDVGLYKLHRYLVQLIAGALSLSLSPISCVLDVGLQGASPQCI